MSKMKIFSQLIKAFKIAIKFFYRHGNSNKSIYLIINRNVHSENALKDIIDRTYFFFKEKDLKIIYINNTIKFLLYFFRKDIKLIFGFNLPIKVNSFLRNFLIFNIDPFLCHDDGWNWHYALSSCFNLKRIESQSFEKLQAIKLSIGNYKKSYLFGTGPSLENAINHDWSDGFKIVSNSIVKDKKLFEHIKPNLVVACDAIYHFGQNLHSQLFLKDLNDRLNEANLYFVFPSIYYPFVSNILPVDKLIAIPINNNSKINKNLFTNFYLPTQIGNVFNVMLLPLGTTFNNKIELFGFDGRSPNDTGFWKNSKAQSYEDGVIDLKLKHPCFFKTLVPIENPTKYTNNVHGEELEKILLKLEDNGINIKMLHKSWTPSFSKRFNEKSK